MVRAALRSVLSILAGRRWIVALAAARSLAEGLMAVAVPVKLNRLGWTDVELGLIAALGGGLYTAACALYSLVIHRAPLRRVMLLSLALTVAASLAIAATDSKGLLFIFCPLFGLSSAFFWPSLMGWIGESEEEHLVGDMAAFNFTWTSAVTVGYLVGGAAEALGRGTALYLVAAVGAGLALVIPFAHIRGRAAAATAALPSSEGVVSPRFAVAGGMAAFVTVLAVSVPGAIFVKLNAALGFGPSDYGLFWAAAGAVQAVVMLGMGVFHGWRLRRWPLVVCLLASAAGGALVWAAGTAGGEVSRGALRSLLFLGFACLGAGVGMGYALGFYYSVHGRRNRRRNASLFETLVASQSLVGGPVGGVVASRFGRGVPYAGLAGIALATAAAQFAVLRGRDFDTGQSRPYNSGLEGGGDARPRD